MPQEEPQSEPIDIRLYIGMLFFRWKVIVVCFLYALLGGVLYINLTTPEYRANAAILVYHDPLITVTKAARQWASPVKHARMLSGREVRNRAVDKLFEKWGEQMGGRRAMDLRVNTAPRGSTVAISVNSPKREYAIEFLNTLIAEHEATWKSEQQQSMSDSMKMLEEELTVTEEKIETAQQGVIEYTRLNDLTRQEIRASVEDSFIKGVVTRRTALETELFMMETAYPDLKESNFAVISAVDRLARGVATASTAGSEETDTSNSGESASRSREDKWLEDAFDEQDIEKLVSQEGEAKASSDPLTGWVNLRVRLLQLQQKKKELEANLGPMHPRVREVADQIAQVTSQLKLAAELQLAQLKDKHKSMLILVKSLEAVEYKWSAKQLQTLINQTELSKLNDRVKRYKGNYSTLFARYHEMRIAEETKTERFSVAQPATAGFSPVWPDAGKVLLVAIVVGLGSGFGIAFALQFLDNKIQSIKDVEKDLGMEFLGGVPFWVHSGLERTIRPIVTEEHSTGAIEAYRALRTNLTTSMANLNEKILFITSADSREGKTLTALNLAIMTAKMEKKVLLVDFDLRRGRLHRSLGTGKEPGVSDALRQRISLREIVKETRIENLFLAPSGSSIDGSAELMQQSNLLEMLVELQDYYDYIFVDTSPILRVTDTVILTTQGIGAVVYVARVNHTPKPLIKYSLNMLKEANILGLIMNSIEMHKISSLYYAYQYPNYAYYSNAYAYGYNYYHYGEQRGKSKQFRRKNPVDEAKKSISRWFRGTFFPMQ